MPDFTDTPEFKKAVADAAKEAVAAVLAQRTAEQPAAAQPSADFANSLATAIATLTHQGAGRGRPVDPSVLQERDDARKEMIRLLIDADANGKVPTYQLRSKTYLDEVLVEPVRQHPVTKRMEKTVIDWPQIPNEGMIPINDVAKAVHAAFLRSIGSIHFSAKPDTAMRFSARGIVINGAPTPTQQKHMLGVTPEGDGEHEEALPYGGLKVHGNRAAEYKPTRVLGTLAPAPLETA